VFEHGINYTSAPTFLFPHYAILKTASGAISAAETFSTNVSGATGTVVDYTAPLLKYTATTSELEVGDTITTSGTQTAIVSKADTVTGTTTISTNISTSGKYIDQDGWISESSKKIQDSLYYQDYSYVVKSSSSINTWRDQLLASVHPAGWAVFGQVDISTAVQSIANITSIVGLGPIMKVVYTMLLGRRLGTTDQLPINPTPAVGVHDPATFMNSFRISGSSGTITKGALITGNTSGATATAILDTTNDHGVNL
jgi:hypothetical protein